MTQMTALSPKRTVAPKTVGFVCCATLLSVSFPGFKGNELVASTSISGYAISTGSACHANQVEPSRIILAMGRNEDEATGTVRISMGYGTTNESVEGLLAAIKEYIGV